MLSDVTQDREIIWRETNRLWYAPREARTTSASIVRFHM